MLSINIKLDEDFLKENVRDFESQRLRIGILDDAFARKARSKREGFAKLEDTGINRRKIKGKSKLPMKDLAKILDTEYGVFSNAVNNANNLDLNLVTQELIKAFSNGTVSKRRIINAAEALIQNPILRREFGSNSKSTQQVKGFDRPIIDTGAFYSSIKAEYYHAKK